MPTPVPIIQGAALTASLATYYTAPSGSQKLNSVQLTGIRICNTDSSARTVTLHIIPAGGTASAANTRFKVLSVAANTSVYYEMNDVILPGGFIQAVASSADVVALSANGMSYP